MEFDPVLISTLIGLPCAFIALLTALFWFLTNRLNKYVNARISNRKLREQFGRAMAYHSQIENLLEDAARQQDRARLQAILEQVRRWLDSIEKLTRRVDRFQRDGLIRQEMSSIPRAIKDLQFQLRQETDVGIRDKLERAIENRQRHLQALEHLQATMRKAELEIEHTISSLGIIYSQILSGQSTKHVTNYTRLAEEVDEQVDSLNDYLEALEEAHLDRARIT